VRALLDQGDLRDALALLYVASIAILGRRHGLEVPESATESEYLTLVLAQRPADEGHLMRRLVRTWQRLAYAHQEPKPAELEALVLDWDRWQGKGAHAG
jgi:hypothetical protein